MEFDYPLPEQWKWVPLGELADTKGRAIVSGPFGSNISSKFFVEDGIPVIRGNNLTTGSQKFIDAGFVFVTPEKAKELGNVDAVRDDIIFTAAGSLGQVGIIPEQTRFPLYIISNKQMRVRLNRELIDPLFAFQWLSSSPMVEFIQRQNTGSSVPLINLSIVRRLPVPLPPLAEQKAIAAVLGALDDKIELNRRMNATLEAMARALFQSWFVDFDPVRAKLDGRPPAALFPEHLEETALGPTPKGWEVRSLDKTAHYLNGLALQKYPPGDGHTLPVIKIAQLRKGDSIGADRCNTDLPPNYIVQDGDVLFSWSGSLEVELWCSGPGALNQHLFKVTSPEFPKWFYYLWTLYHLDEFRLIAADKATTMGHIQRGHLTAAKVLIPPRPLLDAMTRTMTPLIDQLIANRIQSRTLATLRDTLLPKLLSGEISQETTS